MKALQSKGCLLELLNKAEEKCGDIRRWMFGDHTRISLVTFLVPKLSHTRSCETCRWDVPAAAVIHPHKPLLRLRTWFLTSFISTRLHSCSFVFISLVYSFFFIQFKRSFSYFMCFHFLLLNHSLWFYISYFSLVLIQFIFTHSNFHSSKLFIQLRSLHSL